MVATTQFSLRTVFIVLTVCGPLFAIFASFGAVAAIWMLAILVGGIALHVAAIVLVEALDLVAKHTRPTRVSDRADMLVARNVENEYDRCGIECVVATCDDVQLEQRDHSVRFLSLPVNDEDLEALAELPHVKWLVLDHTNVSGTGLTFLHGLTKLRRLYLRGSQVTPNGIQRLKLAIPEVDVVY